MTTSRDNYFVRAVWAAAPAPLEATSSDLASLLHLTDVLEFLQAAPGVLSNGTLYLRIGKGQIGDALEGPSWDGGAHVQLPGWSVARVIPEPWWPRRPDDWVARRLAQYESRVTTDRCGWLVTGHQVGYGPGHEPLLVHLTYRARIDRQAFVEAAEVYRTRFDVQAASEA